MTYLKLTHADKEAKQRLVNVDQVCWIYDTEVGEEIRTLLMFANGEVMYFQEPMDDIEIMMNEQIVRKR